MGIVSEARKVIGKESRIDQLEQVKYSSLNSPIERIFNEYVDLGEHVIQMEDHWIGLLTKIEGEGESNTVQEELLLENMEEKEDELEKKLESLWGSVETAKDEGVSPEKAELLETAIEKMDNRSKKIKNVIDETETRIEQGNHEGVREIVDDLKEDEKSTMKQIVSTREKMGN